MANVDNPFGLRPIRRQGASYLSGGGNLYCVPATVAVEIAPGDVVIKDGSADANGIPTVGVATAAGSVTGICLGIANAPDPSLDISVANSVTFDSTLNTVASQVNYILVEDDPGVTCQAQFAGTLVADNIGLNAELVPTAPTQDGKSNFEIDNPATTVTLPVKILRVVQRVNNELGEFSVVEVLLNATTEDNNTVGV